MKNHFKILKKDKTLIYLDSACGSLKPDSVIKAISDFYENHPSCSGRSLHKLADRTTKAVDKARKTISTYLGVKPNEIIFTKNTTDSINIVANSLSFKKGDIVLTTDKEHNSNFLPWKNHKTAKHQILKTKNGKIDLNKLEDILKTKKIKLLALSLTSHIDGITIPANKIIKLAHKYNSLVLLDAAQTILHKKINIKSLNADFLAFSSHKVLGPTGLGVLFVKNFKNLTPTSFGGGTVSNLTKDFSYLRDNKKFEAGTQNYAGIIGLAAAFDFLSKIKPDHLKLKDTLLKELKNIKGLTIINPTKEPSSIVSFYIKNQDSHSLAIKLDTKFNIAVRSGTFCSHYYFKTHKIKDSIRVSLAPYNANKDISFFIKSLKRLN